MKTATQPKKKYTLKSIRAVIRCTMVTVGVWKYGISSREAHNQGFTTEEWNAMHEAWQNGGMVMSKEELVQILLHALETL